MAKRNATDHVGQDLKDAILLHLRTQHPDVCRHWFDEINPISIESGVLRFLVTQPVRLRYLQRSCAQAFTEAVQSATGRLLAVRFVESETPGANSEQTCTDGLDVEEQGLLVPDYSFDSFVVGPSNRLAHAAAQAITENLGRSYNPFFIHGGVGLGKTHLVQAICQEVLRRSPSTLIVYLSCNSFIDLFHECVRAGKMRDFRHRFRNAEMLVIDDVHFLSKRDQSQEEFFHTFNSLYQAGHQIVLSSDASPSDIPALEERLVSRFNCGLVVRMDRPCFETKVSILKSKAKLLGLFVPDDVPAYLAARFDSNIRELEGALAKVRLYSLANNQPISLELARAAMSDEGASVARASGQPSIQSILEAVTKYYDLKMVDLLSKKRHKSVTLPRQVCMWLARRHTRYSLEEIGGYIGGRDHTTVLHAVKSVTNKIELDTRVLDAVTRIQELIGARV
ncbi:MAG: chromosomal replication initiator protein DnaA [Phycisphaerales bacterium]|nr:chromosomal replication initiator protein DnaA [Phycisphaerales bacterium]